MGVTIRALEPADQAAWQELYEGYQAFYGHDARPQAFYDAAFARLVSGDARDFHALVAQSAEGALVGLVHYVFHPSLWREDGVCYLQDLFAAPEQRGTGIGRALIEAVYAEADRAGSPAVYWLTAEDNHAGRRLYDRVGVKTPFIRYNRPA
ncbi:GNAT family N-acetyltransferase [Paracoccus cavernae]|uniref:GNAT family N-acetyltransferase n=1 Tax=Paracoccus cavernae TaxID=1571207 RepID=A0ABT8D4E8_9RHOB|nr:GNAT family N-acetyltransferase [Paracoccus cavernae]